MKISIFTSMTDPKERMDPWKEAINCYEKYADEVVMKPAYPRWNTYLNDPEPDFIKPCGYLWERMYVWFDGKVNPCDADYKSYLSPGKLGNKSLKECWEDLSKLRSIMIKGKRKEVNPCDRCVSQ